MDNAPFLIPSFTLKNLIAVSFTCLSLPIDFQTSFFFPTKDKSLEALKASSNDGMTLLGFSSSFFSNFSFCTVICSALPHLLLSTLLLLHFLFVFGGVTAVRRFAVRNEGNHPLSTSEKQ